MKTAAATLAALAFAGQVIGVPAPQHQDINLSHSSHEKLAASSQKSNALQWIGPIAPAGEVYSYYGNIKDVGMQMVQVAREAQVHHVGGLVRRKKIAPAPVAQDKIVCDREDMTFDHYGETWAAYKLASVVGALAATNKSSVVVVGGGHGHCVDLTACDENERARIQLCNDNPEQNTVRVQTIAEYAYRIIYECARQDGSGLIWGQEFDDKQFNVIISGCPATFPKDKEPLNGTKPKKIL